MLCKCSADRAELCAKRKETTRFCVVKSDVVRWVGKDRRRIEPLLVELRRTEVFNNLPSIARFALRGANAVAELIENIVLALWRLELLQSLLNSRCKVTVVLIKGRWQSHRLICSSACHRCRKGFPVVCANCH